MNNIHTTEHKAPIKTLLFIIFGVIGLLYLIFAHQNHFLGYLPYLLLITCPLLHLFMHHGHGNHDDGKKPVINPDHSHH